MTREEYDKAIETREIVAKAIEPVTKVLERCKNSPESFLGIEVKPDSELYNAVDAAYWTLCDLSGELGFQIRMVHVYKLKEGE